MDLDGSIDRMTQSATFPAWVAVISAALFGLVFLLSLVRAERTVANGALAALTFTGLAIAAALGLRTTPDAVSSERTPVAYTGLPALACIDDLAGETTLAACEKALFSAPETVAAAVAYTASRINRLVANGTPAEQTQSTDMLALRNAIERDRYGLVAYVLTTRDKCKPSQCAAYASMTDHKQVSSNMDGLIYEGLVARYASSWSANTDAAPAAGEEPLLKPSSIDFPSAASIPPVSIMTPEPAGRASQYSATPAPAGAAPWGAGGPYVPAKSASPPKKRSAAKRDPEPAEAAPAAVDTSPFSIFSR